MNADACDSVQQRSSVPAEDDYVITGSLIFVNCWKVITAVDRLQHHGMRAMRLCRMLCAFIIIRLERLLQRDWRFWLVVTTGCEDTTHNDTYFLCKTVTDDEYSLFCQFPKHVKVNIGTENHEVLLRLLEREGGITGRC